MSDTTLGSLDSKIDIVGASLEAKIDAVDARLDAKIDALGTRLDKKIDDGFAKAFEQTQGGFKDHCAFTEFVVERSAKGLRREMSRRFDTMDARFDRLEQLVKARPDPRPKRPRPRT